MTTSPSDLTTRIDVAADKPGRWVGVEIAQGVVSTGDRTPWKLALSIELGPAGQGPDHWTWLTAEEALQVANALVEAADRAYWLCARDPRDQEPPDAA